MFTDEVHTLVGAGRGEKSNLDVANILKPYLDRGDIKIITSTTNEEYELFMNDSAFKSRFKKIRVEEPDRNTLLQILDGVIKGLEKLYNVKFDYDGIIRTNIFNLLIDLTMDKNRDYKDKINNPRLLLSIVKDMFISASYNNHESILIDDIIFGIDECDRIYVSVKEKYKVELNKIFKSDMKESSVKVLRLYNKDNL